MKESTKGLWILMILLILTGAGLGFALPEAPPERPAPVVWIYVDTAIHPIAAQYIRKGIEKAEENRAEALILQLNTPGGLVSSSETIIQDILRSKVPVVGYVAPSGAHAASAGFFILMATDVAAMAPGTRTGAATPIIGTGGGNGKESEDAKHLRKKAENDLIALMKSLTRRRHRNTDLALMAIKEARAFDEHEALERHLIEVIARDRKELLEKLDGMAITLWNGDKKTFNLKGSSVIDYPMSLQYRLLSFIMDPNIIFILFTLGMLGIYIELSHPGLVLPGLVGVICLILALVSSQVMPISWGAVSLIAIAFLMFLLEIKITSFGMLTLGGLVLLILGGMMLTDTPLGEWQVSRSFLFTFVLVIGVIVGMVLYLVIRTHRRKPMTGTEGMVGQLGWAESNLTENEMGWVFVDGSLWQARSSVPIQKGQRIRVKRVSEGMILEVEPVQTFEHGLSSQRPEVSADSG